MFDETGGGNRVPAVPRIARVAPGEPVTRPAEGIPVIARLRWLHGAIQDVPAIAVAWSRAAVEIRWQLEPDEPLRCDWIAAGDIRRTLAEPPPNPDRPPTSRRSPRR
jgi:hypothetical protein